VAAPPGLETGDTGVAGIAAIHRNDCVKPVATT